jgi:hypothetical protein
MMANKKPSVQVYYRVIKAERGHPFAGLYAVEKVFYKGNELLKREIVHEWDLRIISESILAKLGGGDAYESFKLEHEVAELEKNTSEAEARTVEDLKDLTAHKLANELKLKPVKE